MKFLTSYYWQGQENATSLTLQQIRLKRGGDSLLLACVCDSRDFCGHLVDWLHEEILRKYGRKGSMDWSVALMQLRRMAAERKMPDVKIARTESCIGTGFSCAGILCLGSEFLMFGQGEQRVYLLNQGFRGARIKKLMGTGEPACQSDSKKWGDGKEILEVHQGMMESGVGIVLATESFYAKLTEQMLLDCLGGDIRNEKQASLHLKELGEFSRSLGGRNLGAVFMRTQS